MKRTPLKRTAFKRKPAKAKKRPTNPCCWSNRCKTRVAVRVTEEERYCAKHATWILDKLVGDYVKRRDGGCVYCGKTDDTLQWAHVHTRGQKYIKYVVGPPIDDAPTPGNTVCLCAAHHFAFTQNEGNWRRFLERAYPGAWLKLALLEADREAAGGHIDKAELIRYWRSWWAEQGVRHG